MMKQLVLFFTVSSILGIQASEFANLLRTCKLLENQALDSCLKQVMERIRPRLKTGIPELLLPPLEPFTLRNIRFKQGAPPVVVDATFNNVLVRGVSNFTIHQITADPRSLRLKVSLYLPRLLINGKYNIDGNIFLLAIKGTGPFYSVLEGINADGVGLIVPDRVNDRLTIRDVKVAFNVQHMRTKLDRLFEGDEILGKTVNHFINENGHEILKEIEPEVARQINELVSKVMNDAFSQLPVDTILN